MTEKKFYVYEHWRPDTGVIFYVGKGHGKRAYTLKNRNRKHAEITDSLAAAGFALEVKIVANNLDEETAFSMERQLIANWRSIGAQLVNLTSGGQGASGIFMSKETRRKLSEANKGKLAAFKGRRHTPETIAILSQKAKERGPQLQLQTPEAQAKAVAFHTGRKRSPQTCQKISEALKGKPNWAKGKPSKLKGTKLSQETKNRMAAAAKERWIRQKESGWINPRIGQTCSDEARANIIKSQRLRRDRESESS